MPSTQSAEPTLAMIAAVILAAGKSTRMKSKLPKALHPILGKPLLRFAADAARDAGVVRTVIVVGHQAEIVRETLGPEFEYVEQHEQNGTGHAVQMAESLLHDWHGPILVLPGDAPLLPAEALQELIAKHIQSGAAATVLTATLPDAGSYGRVIRDPNNNSVRGIIEAKDCTEAERLIQEINTSVYVFHPPRLFEALKQITPSNAQGEFYLTDVIALLSQSGHIVQAHIWSDAEIVKGINTRRELVELTQTLRMRVIDQHFANGVTIMDPGTTYIDADVKIGQDTVILPFTMISGVTDIGEDCRIGPGARIADSVLGRGVWVRDSHVVASEVGEDTKIGPFANLRPGNVVGAHVKIGDFVELKQTVLGDHVSAGHFSYLGDAEVGHNTNIGAGVITCNFDGMRKHKTIIGADGFIGTNATLVAPVVIGENAFVAAGSTITDNVPDGALGIGRGRQTNKEGWVAKSRLEQGAEDQT